MAQQYRPKVLIDLSPFRLGHCGLWEYAYRFGSNLLSAYNPDEFDLTFLVAPGHPLPKTPGVTYKEVSFLNRHTKIWTRPYDLFHSVSFPSPFSPVNHLFFKGKMIVTLHDLNFLYEKSDIKILRYLQKYRHYISRVDQLVCISQFAENDARKHLNYQCPGTVIHNGVATYENVTPKLPQVMQTEKTPFLFSISTFMRKKNLHTLIPLMQHLPEYKLVIAGKVIHHDYYQKTLEMVHELGLEQRVIFMGEIPEEEKVWLYQHCSAFLFPSLAEGFGAPPVEAMSFGKPVFVSNSTSIPEICGSLAFYWENFEAGYMANIFRQGIQTYQNDSEYPQKIRHYATSHYSWKQTTMKYIELYRKALFQGH